MYHQRMNTVWITFIANQHSTRINQRVMIKEVCNEVEMERPNVPVVIFLMNNGSTDISFDFFFRMPPLDSPRG